MMRRETPLRRIQLSRTCLMEAHESKLHPQAVSVKLRLRTVIAFLLAQFFVSCLFSRSSNAATPITFDEKQRLWVLQSGQGTYAFGVNERGELQHLYWGKRIGTQDLPTAHSLPEWASFDLSTTTTPQEYPGWGAGIYVEPGLKVSFASGNREVVLHYLNQKLEDNNLEITLKDEIAELYVHLHYRVYADNGIIERSSRIENRTPDAIIVESAQSAAWTLPQDRSYRLHYLTGRWAGEWQLQTERLQVGKRVLESRRGSTGNEANPWFAIDESEETDETHGPVWFGELGWSGSWRFTIERTSSGQCRVVGGFNPFDFGYRLSPGESLRTPPFYAGFTGAGLGEASRILHRFQLEQILPGNPHPRPRPILYNSWEATEFNVDEAGQMALAEKASRLGVERFVVDDGWFGKRNNDHAGLGDWYVNPQKFPHGLKPLIDRVHQLGMDFGLWVEPEMVNPDSDLYRKHPDWVMNFPGRPRTEGRNQLALNLARDDVKEHVFSWLDRLVTENDIGLLKWDYNRNWSEPGWPETPLTDQKKIWVRYVQNLYDIIDRLRSKHPRLEIEGCSGGGARVDLGMLRRVDQVWPSDNTDALDRLTIQSGFTEAYSPHVMMAWVTDVPNGINGRVTPLRFRFLVAMTGSLGVGGNLNKWSDDEIAVASKMISFYKQIRATVQDGELFRLASPIESEFSAMQYVSQDSQQVVVFAFLHSQQFGRSVPLLHVQSLAEDALYSVTVIDNKVEEHTGKLSGAYLMHHGIELRLRGDYDATAIKLDRLQ
jgi:alpha-galactosidase